MNARAPRDRFVGEIAAFGTTLGHRIVIGSWRSSRFGPFADIMHESPDGLRTLHAPTDAVARYVSETYEFDQVCVGPITADRGRSELIVTSGEWALRVTIGRRTLLGRGLRLVPEPVATAPWWCRAIDPIARRVQRGVSTRGTARAGRVESYGAVDQHHLDAVSAKLRGDDLGSIADVDPPVRFGFSSAPRSPCIVAITTTIERADR